MSTGLRACVGKGSLDYFPERGRRHGLRAGRRSCRKAAELELPEGSAVLELRREEGLLPAPPCWHGIDRRRARTGLSDGDEPEGRVLTLEFPAFFLFVRHLYTPNARRDLSRLEYRVAWEERFRAYLTELDAREASHGLPAI